MATIKTAPGTTDLGQCANCSAKAVVQTDGVSAEKIGFCVRHRPDNI